MIQKLARWWEMRKKPTIFYRCPRQSRIATGMRKRFRLFRKEARNFMNIYRARVYLKGFSLDKSKKAWQKKVSWSSSLKAQESRHTILIIWCPAKVILRLKPLQAAIPKLKQTQDNYRRLGIWNSQSNQIRNQMDKHGHKRVHCQNSLSHNKTLLIINKVKWNSYNKVDLQSTLYSQT